MRNITYPSNFFDRPFADTGNRTIVPENQSEPGRASLSSGFPTETQLPIAQGGTAPNRLDFNGALYMLSSLAFWQQSGGQWQWNAALNYTAPCLVYHVGKLWWCLQANGPQSSGGLPVEPGTNSSYWIEFLQALAGMSGGGGGGLVPVGTIIMYYSTIAPDGYLICDGSTFSATTYPSLYSLLGQSRTPDMRGLFVRGYDSNAINDPDGGGREIGIRQEDAIRNITGAFNGFQLTDDYGRGVSTSGAFGINSPWSYGTVSSRGDDSQRGFTFDASRVVPTSDENRPKNINLLYCIKHD